MSILGREIAEWNSDYLQSRVVFIGKNERKLGIRAGDFAGLFMPNAEEVLRITALADKFNSLSHGPDTILCFPEGASSVSEQLDDGFLILLCCKILINTLEGWRAMALCRGLIFAFSTGDFLILDLPLWDWTESEETELFRLLRTIAERGKTVIVASTRTLRSPYINHTIILECGVKIADEIS